MNNVIFELTGAIAYVVNDDPAQLKVLTGLLRKAGVEPFSFAGTEAALEAMGQNHPPDLIITGLYKPDIDGWRLCRLLRSPEYPSFNQVPIIVVSATFAKDELERIATDLGVDAFLSVPVEGKHLLKQVKAILDCRQMRSPLRVNHLLEIRTHELQKSEEKYRNLFDTITDAVLVHRIEDDGSMGRFIEVNDVACQLLGYTKQELLNLSPLHIIVNEGATNHSEIFNSLLIHGKILFEATHIAKDGRQIPMENHVRLFEYYGQRAVLSISRDISDRKQAEEAIRRRLNYERCIADCISILAESLDLENRLARVLKKLQATVTASRSYIFKNENDPNAGLCMTQIHESCANGVKPQIDNPTLRHLPYKDGAQSLLLVLKSRRPYTRVVAELTGMDRKILESQGIVSILILPIFEEDTFWGFIGFDDCLTPRQWQEEDIRILTTVADATGSAISRHRAEKTLRESEKTYRALVDGLPDIVMRFDHNGRYLFVSENITDMVVLQAEHFIGKTFRDMGFSGEQCRFWENAICQIFINGAGSETEFIFEGKKGEKIFNCRFLPEFDTQGKVKSALSICRDITRHRQAEQNLQTLFREMIEGFALHEIICDEQGKPANYRFLSVNPSFERMTGLKKEHIIGKTVLEILPGIERHWIDNYGKVALTGNPFFFDYFSKDLGKHFEVRAFCPAPNQFACTFADITERKSLEARLRQAQKMESVGRLAGGVAHDFNNMLGVILGHTEMALEQLDPSHSLHAGLREIENAARHSTNLTRQLLAFARKQTIAPKKLHLNETIEGMLRMIRRLIGENIHLAWLPGANLWPVRLDPSQIDQILANLCVNARDAINDVGEITIETRNIVFDADRCAPRTDLIRGEYVMLAVSDNGCGMNKETEDKIFEPFFTTKDVGKGTGLGLATVYGIVRQNKGFIDVFSKLGHGTTFSIFLPRYKAKDTKEINEKPMVTAVNGEKTILVVEDELAILQMTKMMLQCQGYTVLVAGTPGEAICLAETYPGEIHLLMTDVIMPEMNGKKLSKNLLSFFPNLKCLFMSGYTADVIAHHGVLDPGIHFIQKPFTMKNLFSKLREALED